jgi:phosphatidylglycerophosphatase C
MARLALFDFDGTLTRGDSFAAFLRFTIPSPRLLAGAVLLMPTILRWKLGFTTNSAAKEAVVRYYYSGMDEQTFRALGARFADEKLASMLKPEALRTLVWHREAGDTVVVVSASIVVWLEPWVAKEGIDLLCTGVEVKQGRITGHFDPPNCHGAEKEKRIRAAYDLSQFDEIYAYGDSRGDTEMLALATHPFYRAFPSF